MRPVVLIGRKSIVFVVEWMETRLSSRRNERSKAKLAMNANIIMDPSRTKQMFIISLSDDPRKNEERKVAHVIMDKQSRILRRWMDGVDGLDDVDDD